MARLFRDLLAAHLVLILLIGAVGEGVHAAPGIDVICGAAGETGIPAPRDALHLSCPDCLPLVGIDVPRPTAPGRSARSRPVGRRPPARRVAGRRRMRAPLIRDPPEGSARPA